MVLPGSKKSDENAEIVPIEKPRAFNERSASPWERTRNNAKDSDERSQEGTLRDSERRSLATKSTTMSSPKNSSPRGRTGLDTKNEREKEVPSTEESTRENNTSSKEKNELPSKIKTPIRGSDQKNIIEKEKEPAKTQESQFAEAYNVELMHTTRTERSISSVAFINQFK